MKNVALQSSVFVERVTDITASSFISTTTTACWGAYMKLAMKSILLLLLMLMLLLLGVSAVAQAQLFVTSKYGTPLTETFGIRGPATNPPVASQCHSASDKPIEHVSLPGRAFHAISTRDGCWIFVSMHPGPNSSGGGVAVLRRDDAGATVVRILPGPRVSGLALTHDEHILVAAEDDRLNFYDVGRLTSAAADVLLGVLYDEAEADKPFYFHMAITANDRLLFVSNHGGEAFTVIDLAEARRSGFRTLRVIGKIPTGYGSNSLALSADGRYAYALTQIAHPTWHWSDSCRAPGAPATAAPNHPQGAVHVIDVSRVAVDASHAVLVTVPAGCDPVRLVLSPKNDRVYITARSDNKLLAFDTRKLLSDSPHALVGTVATPTGSVGVVVLDAGRKIAVANALRFSGPSTDSEVVTVISAAAIARGQEAILGTIPSGGGPVDLSLMADGKTLLVPNYEPKALTLLQFERLVVK
jgi:hypothetical protein